MGYASESQSGGGSDPVGSTEVSIEGEGNLMPLQMIEVHRRDEKEVPARAQEPPPLEVEMALRGNDLTIGKRKHIRELSSSLGGHTR